MPSVVLANIRHKVRTLIDALLASDEQAARLVVDEALALLKTRMALFSDVMQPAQYEIGELWYEGRIGVADEHRATEIVQKLVRGLPPTPIASPVSSANRCVLAALGDETHVLGLRMFELALQDDGWATRSLGGQASIDVVMEAVKARRTRLVGLTAAYLPSAAPLQSAIRTIKSTGTKVFVGGAVFNRIPDLWTRLGADGHGSDARVGVVLARRIAI